MDQISRRYGLASIELQDKAVFEEAFRLLKEPVSDYTFANTFIWRSGLKLYWTLIEGHLCVFANGTGDLTLLIPPIGDGNIVRCIHQCFEIMDDYNDRVVDRSHSRIEYVSEEVLQRLQPLGLAAAPMGGDYVYDMAKMIELPGQDLKSKRQARNKFLREHDVTVAPLTATKVPACKDLLWMWQQQADSRSADAGRETSILRRRDTMATEMALDAYEALGLRGMVLWADGELIGFTLGEPLSAGQASIVIEKTDHTVAGAAQFIFSEFCRCFWPDYGECNVGDDWGIPSLQWTKQSYRPLRLLSKYVLTAAATPILGWTPEMSLAVTNPKHMVAAESPGCPAAASAPKVTVVKAAAGDINQLVELEHRVFGEGLAFKRRQLKYLLQSRRALVWVAKTADHIVGWAILLVRHHRRYDSARLYSLAVDEAQRGQGVGHLLVNTALETLNTMHIERCFLEVAEDNTVARNLYRKLGFVDMATLPDYYGEGRHGVRMLRAVNDPVQEVPVPS